MNIRFMSYKEINNEKSRVNPNVRMLSGKELRDLQNVLLEMYLDIQEVCSKNGIVCMLLGGSALGTVRHCGFIPWDDDLDIGMPRDDYERFKCLFKKELGDKYILNAPNYEGIPTNRFPKVLKKGTKFVESGMQDDERACIKTDIFIIENVPDNLLTRYIKGLYCTCLMFIGGRVQSFEDRIYSHEVLSCGNFLGMLFSFHSSKKWFDRIDRACQHKKSNTKYMNIPTGRKHYFGEILNREVYLPTSQGIFEGEKVYLPGNSKQYLKNLYGDYMKIPPEDKREHHYIQRISF